MLKYIISISQAKKSICICNNESHLLCPTNVFNASSSNTNFIKYLFNQIKDEQEIDFYFYSKQENFTTKIDLSYFNGKKITLKALNVSKSINLQIKPNFLPFYKKIKLNPNYEINYPDLFPHKVSIVHHDKTISEDITNPISDQISMTVPLSVVFLQFQRSGTNIECSCRGINDNKFNFDETQHSNAQNLHCDKDNLDSEDAYHCGLSCWTEDRSLRLNYTFKGVQFGIYGTKNQFLSRFQLELDGQILGEIDEYGESGIGSGKFTLVYMSGPLEYKEHKVRILPYGNKHYEIFKLVYWPSFNAKRINSTSFRGTDSWSKESDGIGGARHYKAEGSASIKLYCSKFWIYGVKDTHLGDIYVEYNGITDRITQSSKQREEGVLMYESPELSNFNTELKISSKSGIIMLYCIYYEEPPIPLSVGLTHMEFEGSNDCVVYNDSAVSFSPKPEIQSLGCNINNLNMADAYQCGLQVQRNKICCVWSLRSRIW